MPHLEITEVVLVHYNIVNNSYQQDSRVVYIFVPNKSFGQLLDFFSIHTYTRVQFEQLHKYIQNTNKIYVNTHKNNL